MILPAGVLSGTRAGYTEARIRQSKITGKVKSFRTTGGCGYSFLIDPCVASRGREHLEASEKENPLPQARCRPAREAIIRRGTF